MFVFMKSKSLIVEIVITHIKIGGMLYRIVTYRTVRSWFQVELLVSQVHSLSDDLDRAR